MFVILALSKAGYGSVPELLTMDTPFLLDCIEFERISSAIEKHHHEQAKAGKT